MTALTTYIYNAYSRKWPQTYINIHRTRGKADGPTGRAIKICTCN